MWDYSVVIRRSSVFDGDTDGSGLKGNHFFGDKRVLEWENLLDHKPQNLLHKLSLIIIFLII